MAYHEKEKEEKEKENTQCTTKMVEDYVGITRHHHWTQHCSNGSDHEGNTLESTNQPRQQYL